MTHTYLPSLLLGLSDGLSDGGQLVRVKKIPPFFLAGTYQRGNLPKGGNLPKRGQPGKGRQPVIGGGEASKRGSLGGSLQEGGSL